MGFKQEVANGIVESIADLRKGDELEDFTVIVDGVSVRCHRFILGACSLFFRAMFRSGMKESEENCVTLKSISHPTFTLILSALYTGYDILSEENVIDVWRAAHMLEIRFLLKECEVFLKQDISIKNYGEIYENAKLLDSDLLKDVHSFMLKNFDIIYTSQTFLELSVSESEIKALIDSDELVVSSEDNVFKTIMRWISYVPPDTIDSETGNEVKQHFSEELPFYNDNGESGDDKMNTEKNSVSGNNANPDAKNPSAEKINKTLEPKEKNLCGDCHNYPKQDQSSGTENQSGAKSQNGPASELDSQNLDVMHQQTQTAMLSENRQEHLLALVSAVRSCFLSPDYLETILLDSSIKNNPVVRALLKAVYYQLQVGRRHGQWPSAAIHRYCSPLKNVVVWTNRSHFRQRDQDVWMEEIASSKAYRYTANFKTITGNLISFDNELYELTDTCLYVFRNGEWNVVLNCSLPSNTIMIAVGNSIFFFIANTLWSVNPSHQTPQLTEHNVVSEASSVNAVTSFKDLILVFGSHINEQNDQQTTVHTFDPSNGTWKKLDNIGGPASDLISFRTDNKTFLLQTNGSCWNVQSDGNGSVMITFSHKAWDFHWDLYGAVTFRDQLLLVGGKQAEDKTESICFPEENLHQWTLCSAARVSVTPIIMDKQYFTLQKT